MKGQTTRWITTAIKKVHASFLPTTPQPIIKKLNKCSKRHEMSPFTSMVRHDLIFLLFEACIFKKVMGPSFVFP